MVDLKTKGNPFFATQFIKLLPEDGFITFNFDAGYWQCDLAKVRELSLNDDVVEFMALQLQKLPEVTQEVLKLAACIGNQFDLGTLSIVHEKSQIETAADLWKALQEGLIIPVSEIYKFFQDGEGEASSQLPITDYQLPSYKFLHDRVQQAAYSLIVQDKKQATHLKIGQLLLKNILKEEREEKIFEIVNQLNMGVELITEQAERDELAELNLLAGGKAKAATAYVAALEYANVGIGLLRTDSWQSHYELTLALYELATEVTYLCGLFEQMEQLVETVLHQTKTQLDQIRVYEIKIQAYTSQNKLLQAIAIAQKFLFQFGISFPDEPTQNDIQQALQETSTLIAGKNVDELIYLSLMTSPEKLAVMRIVSSVVPAIYIAEPKLYPLMILSQIKSSIQYGNAPYSAFFYASYGLLLNGIQQDIEAADMVGRLALGLLKKIDANEIKARTILIVGLFVVPGKYHLRDTLHFLQESYQAGLETGDLEFVGYSANDFCQYSYLSGQELGCLEQQMKAYTQVLVNFKQVTTLNYCQIYRQAVLKLLGKTDNSCVLLGEAFNEEGLVSVFLEANDMTGLYCFYVHKLILCYLFCQGRQALAEAAAKARQYLAGGIGYITVPIFHFYDSLTALALYPENQSEQDSLLKQVADNQAKLQKWADHAPMNHLHKFYLVEAERHRVLGEKIEAMEMYDRAIKEARINEYINEEALANELAAKFYLEWGKDKIAQTYAIDAYYCYARWGAKAKVEDLEQRYPDLLAPILLREKISPNPSTANSITSETFTSTSAGVSALLDLTTVMKAAQTLSEEIVLEQLLSTLMQVLIENAGAENGCLILPKDGNLVIEATKTSRSTQANVLQSIPVESSSVVPVTVINYVWRTQKTLVTSDVTTLNRFASDPYIIQRQPKSLLCSPIVNRGKLIGILYLENNLIAGAFTSDRISILNLLCTQAAISLENARLYQKSQDYAQQLEASLQQLQQTQLQMIQSEKMSALGNLVAGVAHEINNPVGFISGNINEATATVEDLINHLRLYQEKFANPGEEIERDALDIDLEYALSDLPKMLSSMKVGCDRIRNISTSLRTFSRADSTSKVSANLHEGLDTTLMILQYRLKAKETRPAIQVIKEYGKIPSIKCYFGQLNQVFMNIISNAIDALEESNQGRSYAAIEQHPNMITIKTEIPEDNQSVVIKIKDNGLGMTEEVKSRIFDHLFTTKGVGKGTGLGLSISRQIVEETHGGSLTCESVLGEGTEFAIVLPLDRA